MTVTREDLIVQHRSMADEVTDRTRRLIMSRQLKSGQRITQAELAKMMGVSTMPVREALLRLVSEGMVVADSNRSFTIAASTTPQGIRDIYWIHAALAGELTARAWDSRSDEFIKSLQTQHTQYLAAMKSGVQLELFQTNWGFHATIHRAAASPAIALTLKNTLRYMPDFTYEVPGWNQLAADWQQGLLDQFTRGNREGARAVVADCCARSAEIYIAAFWADDNG
ncbi:GntR family transcriptional regulator [Streptomyces sp. NPDC001978]|uniref:GntR family transcriptional regulator n=1 Tax=Streptomyces sp. NPDC001978 TaxID=3364627 RepID=UPI0036979D2A